MSRPAIREERAGDGAAIAAVIDAAFAGAEHSGGNEAAIVRALREADALSVSLIAEQGAAVIGHVAFSPVSIGGQSAGWFGLGPVAVLPEQQGAGIGSALIRQGLERIGRLDAKGCVVLGDPAFYARFGFDPALPAVLDGVPADYFQGLRFDGGPLPGGLVRYHPAFGA